MKRQFNETILIHFTIALSIIYSTFGGVKTHEREFQIKVLDPKGKPVAGARLCKGLHYNYNSNINEFSIQESFQAEADQDGVASYTLHGSSWPIIALDETTNKVGLSLLSRRGPDSVAIELKEISWLQVSFNISDQIEEHLKIQLHYHDGIKTKVYKSLIAYGFPSGRLPGKSIDIPVPSNSNFILEISGSSIKHVEIPIPPLSAGQIFNLGTLNIQSIPGIDWIGKRAPALTDLDWIHGKSLDIKNLHNNIVLLDFWGLWCGPCRRAIPELVRMHHSYSKDGLIIVAVHDSSSTRADILNASLDGFNLSSVPFSIAIDSPESEAAVKGEYGTGKLIKKYNINQFPSQVLIDNEGKIYSINHNIERGIQKLLYGKENTKYEPSFFNTLSLLNLKDHKLIFTVVLLLLSCLAYIFLRLVCHIYVYLRQK